MKWKFAAKERPCLFFLGGVKMSPWLPESVPSWSKVWHVSLAREVVCVGATLCSSDVQPSGLWGCAGNTLLIHMPPPAGISKMGPLAGGVKQPGPHSPTLFPSTPERKGHEEKCVKIKEHGMMVGWPLWATGQAYLSSSDCAYCRQQLTFVTFIGRCAFGWLELPNFLLPGSAKAVHRQWLPKAGIWWLASLPPVGQILSQFSPWSSLQAQAQAKLSIQQHPCLTSFFSLYDLFSSHMGSPESSPLLNYLHQSPCLRFCFSGMWPKT